MKIIATSDWHLGNFFHTNDRLPEHTHFLDWLLSQIKELKPDALFVAGDVFDNGNPSAAAQTLYYKFLAQVAQVAPQMRVVITAGNHDSASRLEAPRPLLSCFKVEIRGNVQRVWTETENGGTWTFNFDDLIIPVRNEAGEEVVVLAVPFLRNDVVMGENYSKGVNNFLNALTRRAKELHPGKTLVMMAHMYANGADIAKTDQSEKLVVGGQEMVSMDGWTELPDYLTCGHIHKRQPIWGTYWARYTGSILPMSFAEKDYSHGVDLLTIGNDGKVKVEALTYQPQHKLRVLPADDQELTPSQLKKLIKAELAERTGGELDEHFDYLLLKVKMDKVDSEAIKELEDLVATKNAVLCKLQRIEPSVDCTTISGEKIECTDDVLNRDPLDALKEAFVVKRKKEMTSEQVALLTELLGNINYKQND